MSFKALFSTLAGLFAASSAHAGILVYCDFEPCSGSAGGGTVYLDYTVPNGYAENWTFSLHNGDPDATISLSQPNEIDVYGYYRLPSGEVVRDFLPDPVVVWSWEESHGPGWANYRVSGPANWNHCDDPTSLGLCGVEYDIWGNLAAISISTDRPWKLHWRVTVLPAPEPVAWALMILGFAGVGARLRQRRRVPA